MASVCELPRRTGICTAAIQRYFHNPAIGDCQEFEYGGCGGNANNFSTLEECRAACPPATCAQTPDAGDCDARIERFFHDRETGSCEPFVYGGCGGNANNFETRQACEGACAVDARCGEVPVAAGPCDPRVPVYAFDGSRCHVTNGCGAGFTTLAECEATCPVLYEETSCETSAECGLVPAGCCEVCTDQTSSDYVALTVFSGGLARNSGCPDIVCRTCDPGSPASRRDDFEARCEQGRCVVHDVTASTLGE